MPCTFSIDWVLLSDNLSFVAFDPAFKAEKRLGVFASQLLKRNLGEFLHSGDSQATIAAIYAQQNAQSGVVQPILSVSSSVDSQNYH